MEKYGYLINGTAAEQIQEYLTADRPADENSFKESCDYVEKFRLVIDEINDLNGVEHFDMVRARQGCRSGLAVC